MQVHAFLRSGWRRVEKEPVALYIAIFCRTLMVHDAYKSMYHVSVYFYRQGSA
jgi:hypothetical protein